MVQLRSGFGPTPSPIEPNFRRLTTIECEKDTPVDRCGKASQASDCIDFIGESLEARAGIEPAHKGFAVYRTSRKSLRKQGTSSGRSPEKPAF